MGADSKVRGRSHLLRILGATFGVAVAVGNMIGAGILRAPAIIAGHIPDTTLIVGLWALGGLHAVLTINIIAELGTAVPQSGGPYLYAHRAFGDVVGLVVGWSAWLVKLAGIAATSIAFGEFLALIWPAAAAYKVPAAMGIQLLLYATNIFGLRQGRAVQEGTSLVKTLMLLAFAGAAIAVAAPHGEAVAAGHAAIAPVFGWAAIIGAYALIRGAYNGADAPVYFTEENTDPSRSIPRALGLGVLTAATLYIAVNAALLYALGPHGTAATLLPFNAVLDRIGGHLPGVLFALGAMVAVAGTANANVMSAPRILFALSRDKVLPDLFQSVNRRGSPDVAILMTGICSLALAATGSFALMFGLIAILATAAQVLVDAALFMLRWKEPDLARPFRAIGYPVLPALVLLIDLGLLCLFAGANWFGAGLALGLAVLCVPFAMIARRARSRGADS